ncbi:MAG: glycosyltransferase [Eudoraea sp.]|nr:glycosyltransferase [Eudoraea sp.]
MPGKVITSLTPNYEKLTDRKVFLWLALISILIRLPFFFRDYVDRDESTFILMAQSWIDGYLPYTQLWDLKPPLVYLFFAAIIYVFGKSFIAIRLIGALAVAAIAFFTFKIGKEVKSTVVGYWAAISCVYLLSLFGSLQGVMSEHLSMLFFMPALYILIKFNQKKWFLIAGILLGISLMMKLNLAYAVLGIAIFFVSQGIKEKKPFPGLLNMVILGSGIGLIIVLTALPYALDGSLQIWIDSVILAPLAYAKTLQTSILKVLPLGILLLAAGILSWKKKWLNFKDPSIPLLVLVIAGVVFSFFKSGKVNGHYLMQLYPMLLVLIGLALTNALVAKVKYYPIILLIAFLVPVESYIEYYAIVKNKEAYGTYFNGEGIRVPEYILANDLDPEEILFFEYHIGYWLLDASPPSKAATHPSNICRTDLFPYFSNPRKTSMAELEYLMDRVQPKTVVTRSSKYVFDKEYVEEDAYVRDYLSDHYKLEEIIGRAEIFSRLKGH